MKILGIDTSSNPASCAVSEDGKVLSEFFLNNKKTHSQTIMGMIGSVTKILELELTELDAVAVSKGPGSFTGLRIGSATAKGLAMALELPIAEISTLEMMAFQICGFHGVICPMLDARRSEVYTGIYRFENETVKEVMKDTAIPVDELIRIINDLGEPVMMLGDGVPVHKEIIKEKAAVDISFAPGFINAQRASALCILAERYVREGRIVDPDMHRPEYLRVSQAERERAARLKKGAAEE